MDIGSVVKMTDKFGAAAVKSAAEMKVAMTTAAITVQTVARAQAPVRTGKLRSSIVYKVNDLRAVIHTGVNYATYVEGGTGMYNSSNPHMIVPKNKKVLASKTNPGFGSATGGGYYIIGKKSQGQKANPFMKRTADMTIPAVRTIFKTVMKEIATNLTR